MYEQIIYLENLFVFNSLLGKYFPNANLRKQIHDQCYKIFNKL